MDQAILVLTSMPDEPTAHDLATQLVTCGLAACVNILAPMRSTYIWDDAVEQATEVALQIKTMRSRYADLESAIQHAHPYDLPEIIAVPIIDGLPAYLDWVRQQTTKAHHV